MADEPVRESRRDERRAERLQQARSTVTPGRVRVLPRDDEMRKLLKHPTSGGFLAEGSVEWPYDQFTKRRVRDGDVTLEEQPAAEPEAQAAQEQQPARQAQAVREPKPTTS